MKKLIMIMVALFIVGCAGLQEQTTIEVDPMDAEIIYEMDVEYKGQQTTFTFYGNGYMYDENIVIFLHRETQQMIFTHVWHIDDNYQLWIGYVYLDYMELKNDSRRFFKLIPSRSFKYKNLKSIYTVRWFPVQQDEYGNIMFDDMIFKVLDK